MPLNRSSGAHTLADHSRGDDAQRRKRRKLLVLVAAGIVFFVSGFVMILGSLSESSAASSGTAVAESADTAGLDASVLLMVGLLVSLGGVVMATAGPLVMYVLSPGRARGEGGGRAE